MGLEAIQAFVIGLIEEDVVLYPAELPVRCTQWNTSEASLGTIRRAALIPVSVGSVRTMWAKPQNADQHPSSRSASWIGWRKWCWMRTGISRPASLVVCSQSSIRHSDLAGTAMRDVEWCRVVGSSGVLGLRAKAACTKSGPRTWAASLLGVHPDNDKWLIRWVELLLVMHGHDWRTHSFVGRAAGKSEGWEMYSPRISEENLTVKHPLGRYRRRKPEHHA